MPSARSVSLAKFLKYADKNTKTFIIFLQLQQLKLNFFKVISMTQTVRNCIYQISIRFRKILFKLRSHFIEVIGRFKKSSRLQEFAFLSLNPEWSQMTKFCLAITRDYEVF